MESLFNWIPLARTRILDLNDSTFQVTLAAYAILFVLTCSKHWTRFVRPPLIFSIIYGSPFFILTFGDSLGDALQVMSYVHARYYMSEPGATLVHHWMYRLFSEPFNWSPKTAVAMSSSFAGVLYFWITARISASLLEDQSDKKHLLFRLAFVAAGSSLLFFGYVENTPLALPVEQAWLLGIVLFLRRPNWKMIATAGCFLGSASFMHGRATFLFPALALAPFLVDKPIQQRFKLILVGSGTFWLTIMVSVGGIFIFDQQGIIANKYGNILGGGNRRMFTEYPILLSLAHWQNVLGILWLAAGVAAPLGLLHQCLNAKQRDTQLCIWSLGYCLCGLVYAGLWEFDFGFFLDWDLLFSGAGGFVFLFACAIAKLRLPTVLSVLILFLNLVVSHTFAFLVNQGALQLNTIPTATATVATNTSQCLAAGLEWNLYRDPALKEKLGDAKLSVASGKWSVADGSHPLAGRPLGVTADGYLYVPTPGPYRIYFHGVGNLSLDIGGVSLFYRWTDLEWNVYAERRILFPVAGWYTVNTKMYTTVHSSDLSIEIESRPATRRELRLQELCARLRTTEGKLVG